MADKDEGSRALKKQMVRLHVMLLLMGLVVALTMYMFVEISGSVSIFYLLGVCLALVGLVLVAISIYSNNRALLASGATLQLVGGAIASVFILNMDDLLTVALLMIVGPMSIGQYQLGSSILTIRAYVEAEGTDFPPMIRDLDRFVLEQIRAMFLLQGGAFMFSFLTLVFVSFFSDVMTLNSLALMGVLMAMIMAGAALLLFLRGGKVVLEEVEEGKKDEDLTKDPSIMVVENA
jgi:hypothetical protein